MTGRADRFDWVHTCVPPSGRALETRTSFKLLAFWMPSSDDFTEEKKAV